MLFTFIACIATGVAAFSEVLSTISTAAIPSGVGCIAFVENEFYLTNTYALYRLVAGSVEEIAPFSDRILELNCANNQLLFTSSLDRRLIQFNGTFQDVSGSSMEAFYRIAAVCGQQVVYVSTSNRIYRLDLGDLSIVHILGKDGDSDPVDGVGFDASMTYPYSMFLSPNGKNLYIQERKKFQIRMKVLNRMILKTEYFF